MLRGHSTARRPGVDCRLVEDWNGDAVANACKLSVMEISAGDELRLWPVNETLPMFDCDTVFAAMRNLTALLWQGL